LGIVVTCGVTARRRSTTSTGEIAPDLRFTCRLGNGRVSAKSQRTRKSTIRISVLSSTPDAASSSFADCHRCSESADQTTSRNTPFTAATRSHPSSRWQRKFGVTSLRKTKLHRKLRPRFLGAAETHCLALNQRKLNTVPQPFDRLAAK
jgi:hypothetical protein